MSARNLHNIPCPRCQKDTLHQLLRCMECGNVLKSSVEQWRHLRKVRVLRRMSKGMNRYDAASDAAKYQNIAAAERRKELKGLANVEHRVRIK